MKNILLKLLIIVSTFIAIAFLLYLSYPSYASIARNERYLSHEIVPTNFIFASISYIEQRFKESNQKLERISKEAQLGSNWQKIDKKTVLVLILGETARADHFGVNGYSTDTTPRLSARVSKGEVVNFTQVSSCGTSTAVSLPCIFSNLSRKSYSKSEAKKSENLLDFFLTTGFSVQWRDNNTGCKGICERTEIINFHESTNDKHCVDSECYDEILLNNLSQQIQQNPRNQVIVLHQKGSHGPAYYLRYPQVFKKYLPTCDSNELQSCAQQHLINTYDNTIYYTDYFIDKTIELLEHLSPEINASMIYMSDHGESLGENNIYLHGTPYFMAPAAQTHVPLMVWLSKQFQHSFNIDYQCLKQLQNTELSHDNYFHSLLGLMRINTDYYDNQLDIFAKCRPGNRSVNADYL